MELSNWAPEHSDALRELIAKGMSLFGGCASHQFADSIRPTLAVLRSDAPGAWDWDRTIASSRRCRPSLLTCKRLPSPPPASSGQLALPWPTPVFKEVKPVKLRCVEIEPRHLSLIELERGDCRYPYGGDEEGEAITFCGHPRRPGSSYCTPHFHLSRDPIVPAERAVSTVSLRVVEAA